jgi:hypothetical protein
MNSENTKNVLGQIEPDLADKLVTDRRSLFSGTAAKLGLLASAPVVLAMASQQAFGAGKLPQSVVDVLNFALTLEYIEDAFYTAGNKAKGLIPAKYHAVFGEIGKHEAEHVKLLKGALGAAAVKAPKADFTAGGKYPDVFSNFDTFATLSQTFEDLGVAAYKGQAGNLIGNGDILTIALRIHSVEARHAAEVRRIRGMAAWDGAFDKPMTKDEVLAAAKPFLVGM